MKNKFPHQFLAPCSGTEAGAISFVAAARPPAESPRATAPVCSTLFVFRIGEFLKFPLAFIFLTAPLSAAAPSSWEYFQMVEVAEPGLVKTALPYETQDKALPDLRDLRLFDPDGKEVSFDVRPPEFVPAKIIRPTKKDVSVEGKRTVILMEIGTEDPLESVIVETPASLFLKAVSVEKSADGKIWAPLVKNKPLFRQGGAQRLNADFPKTGARFLRLSIDDERAEAIPVRDVLLRSAAQSLPAAEKVALLIKEKSDADGDIRLSAEFPFRNVFIDKFRFDTAEPLFTRSVRVLSRQYADGEIREIPLTQGTIYRLAPPGEAVQSELSLSLGRKITEKDIIFDFGPADGPSLEIRSISAEVLPFHIVFFAAKKGAYVIAAGRRDAPSADNDLASLRESLAKVRFQKAVVGPLKKNPYFVKPEALPLLPEAGAALDVSDWKYKARVKISSPGIQRLELTPFVLARGDPGRDLRLVKSGRQVPYILERAGLTRTVFPPVIPLGEDAEKKVSRWEIALSVEGMPVSFFRCEARDEIFRRNVAVYEERVDDRGEKFQRPLGQAVWEKSPGNPARKLSLSLYEPSSRVLILEVENGDNKPLTLEKFEVGYPVTRLLFKTSTAESVDLYFGNPQTAAPRYDIALVTGEILAAEKFDAVLQEDPASPKKSIWPEGIPPTASKILFWVMMLGATIALFWAVVKLLPSERK